MAKPIRAAMTFCVAVIAMGSTRAVAQTAELMNPHLSFPISISSGSLENNSDDTMCLFAEPIHVPGAHWLRVSFGTVQLPRPAWSAKNLAHIRLTSALDGAVQLLGARSIREWRHTSAYFNGDTVLVELISPPGAGPCRIDIDAALFDGESVEPRNTCDATDDRIPSSDSRVARMLPVGCTGWLIRDTNFNFLTAGHCAAGGGTSLAVAEFNVPLSNAGGLINHPPPSDQYAVDPASIQKAAIVDIGNDWTHFGTFDNSTTGLTAYEAQGDAFALSPIAPTAGAIIRKTGCGTTDSTVPREWNQVQKTLVGPLNSFSGTTLSYRIDSSGGDSGSPVFDETNALAVAIHTNGGCTSTGGTNRGCSTLHPDLQTAIANPQGVCIPRYFDFAFPNGRPQWIDPLGGTELLVEVTGRNGHVTAATGVWLWVDSGDGFESSQLESIGGSLFRGPFPPADCAETLRYYVTASTQMGSMTPEPLAAPAQAFLTLAAQSVTTLASFDFETSAGWTVQNINVVSGAWERGIPEGDGTRGDPLFDFDGSGQCWLTGNAIGDSDVDGGPTRLWSPSFNLTGATLPMISYARWFTNDTGEDRLLVELSNNFGVSWTPVESVAGATNWQQRFIRVADFIPPTNITRIRFSVADDPNNSRAEAAIDAVMVFNVTCPEPAICRKGDVNQDGRIDGRDVGVFVEILTGGGTPGSASYCAADLDGDTEVTLVDSQMMTDCLILGNCP